MKASSVGAKTVKGPGDCRVPTSPAAPTASEARKEAKAKAKAERRKQREDADKGLAVADLAALKGDGWSDLAPGGMIGERSAFEPIANLPWVMERARAWSPDARLVRLRIDRVDAAGRVGLVGRDAVDYRPYSPARRASARALAEVSEEEVILALETAHAALEVRLQLRRNAQRQDAEIAAHIAEVLWTMGRKREALSGLRDAQKKHPASEEIQEALKRFSPGPGNFAR